MPLGTRHLTVYERVVVGTDGSPSSQYAVHRAAEVATASEAHLIVVSAYNKGDHASVDTGHIDLTAERSAREAIATSLSQLDKGTARRVEQRAVAADPSRALLDTARGGTGSLIVVGNRGLGAADGQLLGSVPANVVKEADCDVLIVQTAALDEPA